METVKCKMKTCGKMTSITAQPVGLPEYESSRWMGMGPLWENGMDTRVLLIVPTLLWSSVQLILDTTLLDGY